MLKVKGAYYPRIMPTKIAVVLPDDRAYITNLTPFRMVRENELVDLAAFHMPAYRAMMLQDEIPDYLYHMYGLEKMNSSDNAAEKGASTMFSDYHITMDSFGSDCPKNWEEIAEYLNARIDNALEGMGEDAFAVGHDASGLSVEGHEIVNGIWESYCTGEYADAPKAIME